jgi:acyl-CoA thioester hydrolase
MGVVHHSAYVIWMEAARGRVDGGSRSPLMQRSQRAATIFQSLGLHGEYRAPARFGEVVRVQVTVSQLRSREISFAYVVTNAVTGQLLMTGSTEHICVDPTGKMAPNPEAVVARFQGRNNTGLP